MKKWWIWAIVIVWLIIIWVASDSGSSSSSRSNYTSSTTNSNVLSPKNNDASKTYTPLSNWTVLSKDSSFFNRWWWHEVEINNTQWSTDSIFKLVSLSTNKSVYSVYIRKWYSVTISDIPDGNYYSYFASGISEIVTEYHLRI